MSEMPEKLKLFIFQHIDSAELMDVLFYLRILKTDWASVLQITSEIRSSESSVLNRLNHLQSIGLIEVNSADATQFRYAPKTAELNEIVILLDEEYRVKRYQVLEFIFSSAKQAKPFADAFILKKNSKKSGDSNG